jgi:DNA polymerase III delta prime subunit
MILKNVTPTTIGDLVLKSTTRQTLNQIVSGQLPIGDDGQRGVLLHGINGTGKTTAAKMLPALLDSLLDKPGAIGFNASPYVKEYQCGIGANGAALITELQQTLGVWTNRGTSGYVYFILNEVDELKTDAMGSLRGLMDKYEGGFYILTTNRLNRIERGVRDRCYILDFDAAPDCEWHKRINHIVTSNGASPLNQSKLAALLAGTDGSARQIVSRLKAGAADWKAPALANCEKS